MLRHSLSKQKKLFTIRNFSSTPTKMSAKAKVGFIGLGNMGGPMAANLIEKGHSLMVYDINPSSMETLKNVGATIAPNPADIAKSCDRIFTMLPNSQHVETCYKGDNGVFNTVKPGTLLVDSSTIAPNVSKELAALATQKGATFLDAPVSGGEGKSEGGMVIGKSILIKAYRVRRKPVSPFKKFGRRGIKEEKMFFLLRRLSW